MNFTLATVLKLTLAVNDYMICKAKKSAERGSCWMLYLLLIVAAVILSLYAQLKVRRTFDKYSSVINSFGLNGSEIAKTILKDQGFSDINVEVIDGYLTDYYDPSSRTIRLSQSVYSGTSLSSIGVAAHETGHALQHCTNYLPLNIRSSMVHIANIGTWSTIPIIILGLIISSPKITMFGIIVLLVIIAFQIITLPVEFNASKRALTILANGFLTSDEIIETKKVLDAAALTYVAAATTSIAELIRSFFTEKK
ncbi:MAG: zinc metallopeptidase [Deltaproteobacteria bacterium]